MSCLATELVDARPFFAEATCCDACWTATWFCCCSCGVSPASSCASLACAEARFAFAVFTWLSAFAESCVARIWPRVTFCPSCTVIDVRTPAFWKLTFSCSAAFTFPEAETVESTTPLLALRRAGRRRRSRRVRADQEVRTDRSGRDDDDEHQVEPEPAPALAAAHWSLPLRSGWQAFCASLYFADVVSVGRARARARQNDAAVPHTPRERCERPAAARAAVRGPGRPRPAQDAPQACIASCSFCRSASLWAEPGEKLSMPCSFRHD